MNQSYISAKESIEKKRAACERSPDDVAAWLDLGRALVDANDFDSAGRALEKIFEAGRLFSFKNGVPRVRLSALRHYRRNRFLYAKAYADLAMISVRQANLAEAERLLTMALTVFEKESDDAEYARAANRLGLVYRLAGAFESAEEAHYRAKKIAEKHGWDDVLAETLGNLGMVYEGKDRFDLALEQHRAALALYEKGGEERLSGAACVLRQIGLCLLRKGDGGGALETFARAEKTFERIGDLRLQSLVLNETALAHQARGNADAALKAAKKALTVAGKSGDGFETARNKLLCAGLKTEKNPRDKSIDRLLTEAMDYFEKNGKKAELANAAAAFGLALLRRGDLDGAESRFRDSVRIEEMLRRSLGAASDYGNLGLIAQKKGQNEKAADYWRKAAFLFDQSGDADAAADFARRAAEVTAAVAAIPIRA